MVWARLPRTTEHPPRKRRSTQRLSTGGDSPREIISAVKTLKTPLTAISRGECCGLPAKAVSKNHGRKPVLRGLPIIHLKGHEIAIQWPAPMNGTQILRLGVLRGCHTGSVGEIGGGHC